MNAKSEFKFYKKIICIFVLIVFSNTIFSQTISDLAEYALQNNPNILSAQNDYNLANISSKTLNGTYTPQVSFSSSFTLPEEYHWPNSPDYMLSSITYTQPLPGGTSINLTGESSFTAVNISQERYLQQTPNISFSILQSLLPYWIQGKIENPEKLSVNQYKDYYYYQLLYIKKSVLQELLQNYIYALISKTQIQIYQNSISLIDEQIEIYEDLLSSGAINQLNITELQSSKWNYQQDLISTQANFAGYIQNIKTICGTDFEEAIFSNDFFEDLLSTDFSKVILSSTDNIVDPLEKTYKLKIELLKTEHILEKQSAAPTVSLSVQPSWSFVTKKQNDWKGLNSPSSWSANIGINLSPLISTTVNQSNKQYELNYETAENSYNAYLKQKKFVLQQYQTILEQYSFQLQEILNLYNTEKSELKDLESQFQNGAISKFDFDSVNVRVENYRLNMQITQLYVWMYKILFATN